MATRNILEQLSNPTSIRELAEEVQFNIDDLELRLSNIEDNPPGVNFEDSMFISRLEKDPTQPLVLDKNGDDLYNMATLGQSVELSISSITNLEGGAYELCLLGNEAFPITFATNLGDKVSGIIDNTMRNDIVFLWNRAIDAGDTDPVNRLRKIQVENLPIYAGPSAPNIISAQVTNENPNLLNITLDKPSDITDLTGLSLNFTTGTPKTISTLVGGSGTTTFILELSGNLENGDVLTFDYDNTNTIVTSGTPLKLVAGSTNVTNNVSPPITAPTVNSTTVEDADPDALIVVFDKSVDITDLTGFSLNFTTGTPKTISTLVGGSGTNTLTFALSADVENGDVFTFDYGGTNTIVTSGTALSLVAGSTNVTNNVQPVAGLVDITISDITGFTAVGTEYRADPGLNYQANLFTSVESTNSQDFFITIDTEQVENDNFMFGIDTASSNIPYFQFDHCIFKGNDGNLSHLSNNSGAAIKPYATGVGFKLGLRCVGNTLTMEESTDNGASWQVIHTFTGFTNANYYIHADASGTANGRGYITNPKIQQ